MFTISTEKLYLGPTPAEESCAQVGSPSYREQARKECRAYIHQLKRIFGEPPQDTQFALALEPHDFGNYYEVVIWYNPKDDESSEFALRVEANLPMEWDAFARKELGLDDL